MISAGSSSNGWFTVVGTFSLGTTFFRQNSASSGRIHRESRSGLTHRTCLSSKLVIPHKSVNAGRQRVTDAKVSHLEASKTTRCIERYFTRGSEKKVK